MNFLIICSPIIKIVFCFQYSDFCVLSNNTNFINFIFSPKVDLT